MSATVETTKRIVVTLLAASAAGVLVALFVAPGMIEWWAKPAVPTVCSCVEQIEWAVGRLRMTLLVAAGITAAVGVLFVEINRRKEEIGSPVWWILTALTLGYLLPSAIASTRKAKNIGTIQLLNILGGWTGIGFVAALLWAIMDTPREQSSPVT